MVLRRIFGTTGKHHGLARDLYQKIVRQAREPGFYTVGGVPDTIDGRYDMVVVHMFLVLNRLKRDGEPNKPLGQALFDIMITDMDQSLREMAVSDYAIGHRMKAINSAFYGRIKVYDEALGADGDQLEQALRRNLFRGDEHVGAAAPLLADYMRREAAALADRDIRVAAREGLLFGPAPGIEPD